LDAFRDLQVLTLLALALLFAPAALPPLRPLGAKLRLAALVVYLLGGAAILIRWLATRG
jgi:hypothetical protein